MFLALLAPMLKSTTERVTAGLAVLLVLGLLPVLPAGTPVLVSALAVPVVLFLKGRGKSTGDGFLKGRGKHTQDETSAGGTTPGEGR